METELLASEDASYYADLLMRMTGASRNYWTDVPLERMKALCMRLRREAAHFHEKGEEQ